MNDTERALLLRSFSKKGKLIDIHNYETSFLEKLDNWLESKVLPFGFGMVCIVIVFNLIRYLIK